MQYKDYYEILGISATATEAEIKSAYRKQARKFHPDVSKEASAEARFKEINEAYEALKDPKKRKAFDKVRASGVRPGEEINPQGFDFGDMDFGGGGNADLFESLFGAAARGARGQSRRQGADVRATLSVDLETAFTGGKQRVSLTVGGAERTLEVKIPAGVLTGQTIRLAGQGHRSVGGNAGDLLLEVQLAAHPKFELNGRDITVRLSVRPWTAALGAKVAVPTLAGEVQLAIPAGSNHGRKLRLKGRGFPGEPVGDQIVILEIHNPPLHGDADREAFRQLAEHFEPSA